MHRKRDEHYLSIRIDACILAFDLVVLGVGLILTMQFGAGMAAFDSESQPSISSRSILFAACFFAMTAASAVTAFRVIKARRSGNQSGPVATIVASLYLLSRWAAVATMAIAAVLENDERLAVLVVGYFAGTGVLLTVHFFASSDVATSSLSGLSRLDAWAIPGFRQLARSPGRNPLPRSSSSE